MGHNGIGLCVRKLGQAGRIFQRRHRVRKALVALILGLILGVVQKQVMQQAGTGCLADINVPVAGQTIGHIRDKQRMLVTGDKMVVADVLHPQHLVAVQQVGHTGGILTLRNGVEKLVHWRNPPWKASALSGSASEKCRGRAKALLSFLQMINHTPEARFALANCPSFCIIPYCL